MKDAGRKRFIGSASGGEYQAVQILLAILTGYPAEATEILQNLIEKEHPETWGEFVETVKKEILLEDAPVRSQKAGKAPNLARQQTRDKGPTAPRQVTDAVLLRFQRWREFYSIPITGPASEITSRTCHVQLFAIGVHKSLGTHFSLAALCCISANSPTLFDDKMTVQSTAREQSDIARWHWSGHVLIRN